MSITPAAVDRIQALTVVNVKPLRIASIIRTEFKNLLIISLTFDTPFARFGDLTHTQALLVAFDEYNQLQAGTSNEQSPETGEPQSDGVNGWAVGDRTASITPT